MSRYFGADGAVVPAGGCEGRFMSGVVGGVGRPVAAPVVVPGLLLRESVVLGVTSRMPGGVLGDAGWVCADCAGGVVPA